MCWDNKIYKCITKVQALIAPMQFLQVQFLVQITIFITFDLCQKSTLSTKLTYFAELFLMFFVYTELHFFPKTCQK